MRDEDAPGGMPEGEGEGEGAPEEGSESKDGDEPCKESEPGEGEGEDEGYRKRASSQPVSSMRDVLLRRRSVWNCLLTTIKLGTMMCLLQ